MKNIYKKLRGSSSALLMLAFGSSAYMKAQAPVTMTLGYTGAVQSYTVPPCAGNMTVTMWGAAGGTGNSGGPAGANGAYVRGVITATPGSVLYFYVGGQGTLTAGGFNGGGNGGSSSTSIGAGGGGATDIRVNGTALSDRIMVAGGGGGGGGSSSYGATPGAGGAGSPFSSANGVGGGGGTGCATGGAGAESGGSAGTYGSGGGGGGFTSGGQGGGQPSAATGGYGCNGALGLGGDGGGTTFICGGATGGINGGGGGGGGYYGGGGGMTGTGGCNGGGGGGSSWASALFTATSFSQGISAANGSITITFTFNGTPVAVTPTIGAVCLGGSTTLQGSGVNTYTWYPNGNFAGSNNSSVVISPTTSTTYSVAGTNNLGCVTSSVVTVSVTTGPPTLTVTSSSNSVCLGGTLNVVASGAVTYSWTNGINNGITFTPQVSSTYTVQGANGCGTVTATKQITVTPIPVTVAANPSLVCEGYTATLTANSTATGYAWSPALSSTSVALITPTTGGVYTVTVNNGVCLGIGTVSVATKTTPTITAVISNSDICAGDPVTLTANGAGTGGTYSWTAIGGSASSFTTGPITSTVFVVNGTNSLNCTASGQAIVVVKAVPILNVTASKTLVCSGQTIALAVSGGTNYSWAGGPSTTGYTITPTTAYAIYSVTGTHSVNLICTATKTIAIAVFIPSITVSPSMAICYGQSAALSASGANTYTWNGIPSTSGQQVFTPTVTTTYTLGATSQSIATICLSTRSTQVVVNPQPTLSAIPTKTNAVCKNQSNTLTVSGANSYTWQGTLGTNTSVVVSPTITTTYSVVGENQFGCSDTVFVTAKVTSCNGISENANAATIVVYPNPNNGNFYITAEKATQLKLYNTVGQLIRQIELTPQNNFKVELQDVSKGIYVLVIDDAGATFAQRISVD